MTHSTWPFPHNNNAAEQALVSVMFLVKLFVLSLSKSGVSEQPKIVFLITHLWQNISVVEKA